MKVVKLVFLVLCVFLVGGVIFLVIGFYVEVWVEVFCCGKGFIF